MRPRIKSMIDQAFETQKEYTISGSVGLIAIISDEKIQIFANTVMPIRVREIKIPKNHTISPCAYNRHPLGSVISVAEEIPKTISEERKIEFVMFIAWENGIIEEGDVLGVIDTFPIKCEEE